MYCILPRRRRHRRHRELLQHASWATIRTTTINWLLRFGGNDKRSGTNFKRNVFDKAMWHKVGGGSGMFGGLVRGVAGRVGEYSVFLTDTCPLRTLIIKKTSWNQRDRFSSSGSGSSSGSISIDTTNIRFAKMFYTRQRLYHHHHLCHCILIVLHVISDMTACNFF